MPCGRQMPHPEIALLHDGSDVPPLLDVFSKRHLGTW